MSAEPESIDRVIESLADGGPIDWAALEAAACDERERRVIGHLRLVAGVAEARRAARRERAAIAPQSSKARQTLPRWGHLRLLEKIGEGTYADVYRARDPWLDREVALKLLKRGAGGKVPTSRDLKEARTLARVRHPHVVAVYGADVHDGRVGLWMEFVRGRTLRTILAAQGPMSGSEAAVVGQELCRALGAVHAAGLVHGDVKAQNVMRESGGRFVLMDFGAGQFVDDPHSAAKRAAGTPLYLAPEVLQGGRFTFQSDLYALGVLLYLLVTGTYPVNASSLEDLAAAHVSGQRRHLRDARPDLPDAFVATVERALEPDPQRRYATVGEMLSALTRVAAGGISGRMTAIRPASEPPSHRSASPSPIAVAALGLAIIVAAPVWITTRQSGPPPAGSAALVPPIALPERGREWRSESDLPVQRDLPSHDDDGVRAAQEHQLADLRRQIEDLTHATHVR